MSKQNTKYKFRTLTSIDENFKDRLPDTELSLLTLINESMECRGTLRHVMRNTKVWREIIKILANTEKQNRKIKCISEAMDETG